MSPHPPIAAITLTPAGKRALKVLTGSNSLNSPPPWVKKSLTGRKAMMAWSMPALRVGLPRSAVWYWSAYIMNHADAVLGSIAAAAMRPYRSMATMVL